MASGTLEKFKTRPRLRPFSITMAKAVASVTVAALHNIQSAYGLTCYCYGHCPHTSSELSGTCQAKPGSKCFAAVEMVTDPDTNEVGPERTYGCLPPEESGLMQCRGSLVPHLNPANISCCSDEDLCNRDLLPMYTPLPPDSEYDSGSGFKNAATLNHATSMALLVSLTACLVVLIIFVAFVYLRYKKREDFRQQKYMAAARQDPEFHVGTLSDLIEQTSGSGSRLPNLVQRTIARQIQMVREVGRGRYGQVWLGQWRGEDIAVKVFFTTDEDSWLRETEIYQTVLLRHDNILGFIAADIRGTGDRTQMLLITDYHRNGSLYDFLKFNTIDEEKMLAMAYSAAAGISHLHTEIRGTKGKPMIAHRDIKTRNILVKRDLTCVIADFGLAVRYDSETKTIDIGNHNTRVGTRRYMPPEVLDGSLNKDSFQAFLQADVYSFGLVLWELCRRTVTGDKEVKCEDSQLPYYEYVTSDPTEEEMRNVVCIKKLRPEIPCRWQCNETLSSVQRIIQETLHSNPSVRPSHLRVKKAFAKLIDNSVDIKSDI